MSPPPTLAEVLFPARDVRLGTLVRELSEPETGPPADNLVSNEDSYPRVAAELDRAGLGAGVYVGVGPDQNFTLMAHAKPKLAFILDFRRRNLFLHLVHKALMSLSGDRVAYLSRLTARRPGRLPPSPSADDLVAAFLAAPLDRDLLRRTVAEVADVLRPLEVVADDEWEAVATLQARLAGPGLNARFLALPMYPTLGRLVRTTGRDGRPAHVLALEDSYQAVRGLQVGDRVIPLVGDFGGATSLPRLGAWLRRHRLRVSLLYLSDVEFFLFRSGRFAGFAERLADLPRTDGALIVRTSTREIDHPRRVAGDSSTTIAEGLDSFLAAHRAGRIRTYEDLFRPEAPSRPED